MSQSADTGKFLYGIFGSTCVIKAVGKITYHLGGSFDQFISRVISDNVINDFVIDLTETEYIDSTNLGLLARIQVFSSTMLLKRPTLISSSDAINTILQNIGFDRLFTICAVAPQLPDAMQELSPSINTSRPLEEVLLTAHQYLRDTNMKNALVFKDVVELIEKDVHKKHGLN